MLKQFFNCLVSRTGKLFGLRSRNPVMRRRQNKPLSGKIRYIINDLTTPELIKEVELPKKPLNPPVVVDGYQGGGKQLSLSSPQHQAANCLYTIYNTLSLTNRLSERKLSKWAGTSTLYVYPRAGQDLNAFYNRRTLCFFYFIHKQIGEIYTVDSADIVAHELGHAIFDSYRPDTWNAASLEIWSFHEAFADFVAIMNILSHEEVIDYVIKQTNGNLRKPNVASNLAEHVGKAIYKLTGESRSRHPNALRSAINQFKYVHPSTLPSQAPHHRLAAESHSFGRIFLGALYDVLVMIFEDLRNKKKYGPKDCLRIARDLLYSYVLKAILYVPLNANFYESMAKTILWADLQINNGTYHDKMRKIFMDRNLIRPQLRMLSAPKCDNDECIIHHKKTMMVKLDNYFLRAQSDNEYYNAEIEIPNDSAYLYDKEKRIVDVIKCSEMESISAAQDMVNYLHSAEKSRIYTQKPFIIHDGKLVRTCFT